MSLSYQPCLCSTTSGAREAQLKQKKNPFRNETPGILEMYSALQPIFLQTLQTCITLTALEQTHTLVIENSYFLSKDDVNQEASLARCIEASWSSKAHDVTTLESKLDFVFLKSLRGIHIYTDKLLHVQAETHREMFLKRLELVSVASGLQLS